MFTKSSSFKQRASIVGLGLFGFCSLFFIVASALNAEALTEVRIKLQPNQKEHLDKSLTLNKKEWLPDYQVRIRVKKDWHEIGTQLNASAKDWLVYPLNNPVPFRKAEEIQIRDKDLAESDVLDIVQVDNTALSSKNFVYELQAERRFETGMEWFFDTPVGKAASTGIAIAVLIILLAYWPW